MFFHKKTDRSVKTLRTLHIIYIVVRVILLQIIYNSLLNQCRKSIHIGQQDDFNDEEERWLVSFSRKNQTCLLVRDNSRLVKAVLVKKMLCVFSGPVSYMPCQLKIWDRLVWCSFLSKNSTELMKNKISTTEIYLFWIKLASYLSTYRYSSLFSISFGYNTETFVRPVDISLLSLLEIMVSSPLISWCCGMACCGSL